MRERDALPKSPGEPVSEWKLVLPNLAVTENLAHFLAEEVRPGDLVDVAVTYAAPHHLLAEGPLLAHRRTRAGDVWESGRDVPVSPGVPLGMPSVGVPPQAAAAAGCDAVAH